MSLIGRNAKYLILFVGVMAAFFISAYAEDDFSTDYNIIYSFDPIGTAQVKHGVTITNLKGDVIATAYTLGLKELDVFDVSADKLDVVTNQKDGQTNLEVKLKNFVIGENRQNGFIINYKSKSIAKKTGEIWNINIPRPQATSATTTYNISLVIPNAFGPKIFVSPTPTTEKSDGTTTTYSFANEDLKDKNISAAFGNYQLLNFKIKYQIYNPNLFTSNYEIALPPSIKNNQAVAYQSLIPKPLSTHIDNDGNFMAVYKLRPKQNIDVILVGRAKISSPQIKIGEGGAFSDLPKSLVRAYTAPKMFWESNNAKMKEIAKSLLDKKQNVTENANKIYEYLLNNFSYDFNTANKEFVDRKGAVAAISSKEGWACMEFTDSFIAIARSMGIPAREINGYALSSLGSDKPLSVLLKGGDLLHAWPEYYDPKLGWIQVDPTWGDTSNTDYFTKIDTNHFAFVIQGAKSDYPLPAGTYRTSDGQKLVEVDYSQTSDQPEFKGFYTIQKVFNWNIFKALAGYKRYKITNLGKIILYENKNGPLLPGNSKTYYLKGENQKVIFRNAFGEEFTQLLPN